MQNKFDHEIYEASVEKYNLAKELRKACNIEAAILTIKEAGRLFAKIHNRSMYMNARSLELRWLYGLNSTSYYAEQEANILAFLEEFQNYYDDQNYIFIRFNYLKYLSDNAPDDDHEEAKKALNRLLDLVSANRALLPFISDNQLKIWQAQIKCEEARDSTARRDDLATQAEHYLEAATLSTPVDETDTLAAQMLRVKNSLLSTGYKLKAFSLLRPPKLIDINHVADCMRLSLEYAEKAYHYFMDVKAEIHKTYVSYWYNIFSARAELCKSNFRRSIDHLNLGISDARFLIENDVNIFPNYYANVDDLHNERLFVRAHQLLDEGESIKSLSKLKKWLKRNEENAGTWRYNTIKLRFLAVQLLANLDSHFMEQDSAELASYKLSAKILQNEIDAIVEQVKLGKASMKIADLILFLALDFERDKLTFESFSKEYAEILKLFPPDSIIKDYETIASISPVAKQSTMVTLPESLLKELDRICASSTPQASLHELDQLLRCYVILLAEYRYLKYIDVQTADRGRPDWANLEITVDGDTLEELVGKLYQLASALGEDSDALRPLKDYISARRSAECSDNIKGLAAVAIKAVMKTHGRFFPHVVRVISEPAEGEAEDADRLSEYYIAERIWSKEWPKKLFFGREWPFRLGSFYYLEPRWKNFNFENAPLYRREKKPYESFLYEAVEEQLHRSEQAARERRMAVTWFFLEEKLKELEQLMKENAREERIGKYLEANPWVFGDYRSFTAQPRIDLENRPDYFLVTRRNENIIVELKRPGERLFIRRKKNGSKSAIWEEKPELWPSSKLSRATNQLRDYQEAFKRRLITERRGNILPYEPRGILIIGSALLKDEKEKLEEINIEENRNLRTIMTYSQLLSQAEGLIDFFRNLSGDN